MLDFWMEFWLLCLGFLRGDWFACFVLLGFCWVWFFVVIGGFLSLFGFFVIFIFESSALIWERETVTEGKKFHALYLGLTGFVYLQSLVK